MTAGCLPFVLLGRVQALQVQNYVGVIALPGGAFIEVLPKTGNDNAREQLMMMHSENLPTYCNDIRQHSDLAYAIDGYFYSTIYQQRSGDPPTGS
jgi:hypothetical protein